MDSQDMREFDRLMKSYYANRADELDKMNKVLWNIAIDLVRAIADAEHDGSSTTNLKKFGETKAHELRDMLERKQIS